MSMKEIILLSLFSIGFLSIIIYIYNRHITGFLPSEVNIEVLCYAAILLCVTSFIGAFKNCVELFRKIKISFYKSRRSILLKLPYPRTKIKQSTDNYVKQYCSNIDPSHEMEIIDALVATKEPLFKNVDKFIFDMPNRKHLIILADSGTGKTSFVINYYFYNLRKSRRNRADLVVVYLGSEEADHLIVDSADKNGKVIILDAFDEDHKAIIDHKARLKEILKMCKNYEKVIITCRSQFFSKAEEMPEKTGELIVGPTRAGENGIYSIKKIYLSPFSKDDVNKYLRKKYHFWEVKKKKKASSIILKIEKLSARPMLLAYMTDDDITKLSDNITYSYQLYYAMIRGWYTREAHWVNEKDLEEFSIRTALNIFFYNEKRGREYITEDEIFKLTKDAKLIIDKYKFGVRSLLNRDAYGNLKFAHRSIYEFFVAHQLMKNHRLPYCNSIWTDQMKEFLIEMYANYWPPIVFYKEFFIKSKTCIKFSQNTEIENSQNHMCIRVSNDEFMYDCDCKIEVIRIFFKEKLAFFEGVPGEYTIDLISTFSKFKEELLRQYSSDIISYLFDDTIAFLNENIKSLHRLKSYKHYDYKRSRYTIAISKTFGEIHDKKSYQPNIFKEVYVNSIYSNYGIVNLLLVLKLKSLSRLGYDVSQNTNDLFTFTIPFYKQFKHHNKKIFPVVKNSKLPYQKEDSVKFVAGNK